VICVLLAVKHVGHRGDNRRMPATVLRQRLGVEWEPSRLLRALRDQPGLFALIGRWNAQAAIVGFAPVRTLSPDDDPFECVNDLPAVARSESFGGGWVGAWGYQLAGSVERLPASPPRPVPLADFSLAYYDAVLVLDRDGWWFEALADADNRERIDTQLTLVRHLLDGGERGPVPYACGDFEATPDAAGHEKAVSATLEHLAAGDVFQANICRRLDAAFDGDPLDVFCAGVERLSPQYAAFMRTGEGAIASFSPELFLRRQSQQVLTSPIKGTASLDTDVDRLVDSAKNRAENVMIVDLMRNDLSRVCRPGSVRVENLVRAEQHTGVWHLVSDVVGELAPGQDDANLLRATFPPGSVTGAPKVRAMEVITEVEATGRETYTGAMGYVSPCAGLELNVAIRTFEFSAGRVWLGVGGGVVIDSTPEDEQHETLVKAAPLLAAIGASFAPGVSIPSRPGPVRAGEQTPARRDVDAGQGVFTTLLVVDGRPIHLDAHLARLDLSLAACYGSQLPGDTGRWVREAAAPLRGRHRLRLTVVPDGHGVAAPTLTSAPLTGRSRPPWELRPVVVPGGLGAHKYADRHRLSAPESDGLIWSDVCDALVCDSDGSVLETGRGNVFTVTGDAVHTPPLDGRLLPGVMRQRVLDELAAAGIDVVVGTLTVDDLAAATEVFTTNSLDGVRPVTAVVEAGAWAPGPVTAWLQSQLAAPRSRQPRRTSSRLSRRDLRVLLIDNYDSFVYNLDQYVRELGATTEVLRNDAATVDEITAAAASGQVHGLLVSPGPGSPDEAGISKALIARLGGAVPILGVCLGHQCIAEVYGAQVRRADTVVHGKQSLVHHDGAGVFAGLSGPLPAGRYHSLVVSSALPPDLVASARTGSGVLMGLRHRHADVEGVQFHPESILTRDGHHLVGNFLRRCAERRTAAGHATEARSRSNLEGPTASALTG
jgi:para-aminobenzoate synthetase/4-amino-4-deoxychorismate lyase